MTDGPTDASAERRPRAVLAHHAFPLFSPEELDLLRAEVDLLDDAPLDSWDDPRADVLLPRTEVIVGHWGCPTVDADVLARAPQLGLVAYAAGTIKGVVDPVVFERGIRVTSGAPANAEPVAEFALAAILFANKGVFWRTRPGLPALAPPGSGWGNVDKVVGLVGASHVGRRVLDLLAPFDQISVLLHDPFVSDAEAAALGVELAGLDELCERVDVLSIHAPDLPSTRGMIGAAQLARLPDGAVVVNTARPALLDQDALVAELRAGRLGAVLDVTDPEPLPADHELWTLPNAVVTPHLAGSEGPELRRLTRAVVDEVRRWRAGEPARNEVRPEQLGRLA